ncbi:hypothetical protein BRADI_2g52101v3 [Brachypodium distachyon]|uniref:Uncharacterized protein n=1 Tax=Brachypodium distachyon TaxID=15368 RepID=A0A0Q3RAN1_BRADI|nr:hypothetical protein BRADI_2g52101v3 [Brachypodium distachyon]
MDAAAAGPALSFSRRRRALREPPHAPLPADPWPPLSRAPCRCPPRPRRRPGRAPPDLAPAPFPPPCFRVRPLGRPEIRRTGRSPWSRRLRVNRDEQRASSAAPRRPPRTRARNRARNDYIKLLLQPPELLPQIPANLHLLDDENLLLLHLRPTLFLWPPFPCVLMHYAAVST